MVLPRAAVAARRASSPSASSTSPAAPRAPVLLLAVLAVLLLAPLPAAEGLSLCKPMPPAEDCAFGLVRDYCGREVCARGPGERCGGPSFVYGRCGEGMHCKCERCIGCSLVTLTCDLGSSICL